MIKQQFDDDDDDDEEMDEEDEDGEEIDDDNVEKCENCENGICNSVRENYDNTCGDDTETGENGDEHFETQSNVYVALQNNQITQSIISNDISPSPSPSPTNQINSQPLIKQQCLQGSSITSIPLDFANRNAALNDISIDEQIEGQNTQQIQTDEFDDNDEDTEIDSDHERESSSSRPVENPPPMDVTLQQQPNQSRVTRQSSKLAKRKLTEEEEEQTNEVDNRDNQEDTKQEEEVTSVKRSRPSCGTKQKQIITHTLQCPQLNCTNVFVRDSKLLTAHLWDRHSIRKNQCLVKDCAQSFDKKNALGHHRSQIHKFTTQWQCGKCDHHFPSYSRLSTHNREYHQLGHFQCSACTFTGNCRKKVINHYAQQHKKSFKCPHQDCQYETSNSVHFKRHQRTH